MAKKPKYTKIATVRMDPEVFAKIENLALARGIKPTILMRELIERGIAGTGAVAG